MKKLILTVAVLVLTNMPLLAVAGPSQWSLAGVASWAQPLTASGTALPATATYAIGDLFALYGGAASTTFELYRLCASGTAGVWRNTGAAGTGGTSAIIDATDLPSVTGNANKVLTLGTDTVAFWWSNVIADLAAHIAQKDSPHGYNMSVGDIDILGQRFDGNIGVDMEANATINKQGYVVIASYSVAEDDTFAELAPASSTQAIGISLAGQAGGWATILVTGECAALVASDSEAINVGDWVITSDTYPGHVMRAASPGDVFLSIEEMQRRVGYATYDEYYSSLNAATYTYIILKGTR